MKLCRDHRGCRVCLGRMENLAEKVHKEMKEMMGRWDLKVCRDHRGLKVYRDHKEIRVTLGHRGLKVG